MPDGRGHNRHVMAPGGIVYRFTPDGKTFEIFASGFRNIYDGGVNRAGELFVYDADMEYDFNTSWYRPTRINHVVSGAEFGWRNGAGKYPEFCINLPATLNIGPGSPTGCTFGYGAKFPVKYQEAFYALDWSCGKIYAVHLKLNGSTYTATKEEFVTGGPLPVSDAIIGKDGAMYFTIGGRRVQSGLYRVSYVGKEDTTLLPEKKTSTFRGKIAGMTGRAEEPQPNGNSTPSGSLPRQTRPESRRHRLAASQQQRPLHPRRRPHRAGASAARRMAGQSARRNQCHRAARSVARTTRRTGVCPTHRTDPSYQPDSKSRNAILAALLKHDFAKLTPEQRLGYVRLIEIVLHRFGNPDDATVAAIIAKLDPAYPADNFELNWLLTETLAYLQAPNAAAKGMALIAAESQEPQIEYARSLRFLKAGWTPNCARSSSNSSSRPRTTKAGPASTNSSSSSATTA